MSEWQEPRTTTMRLSFAIVLPSGITGFKVRVIEEGDCLELTVDWPKPLTDINMMHRKWLVNDSEFTDVHPKILGFEAALKNLRENCTESVHSTAQIGLPFSVESHIDGKYNIGWREDSTRMLYVDLKATVDEYAAVNDLDEFEIV